MNPNWARDEVILALELYLRVGSNQLSPRHPEVVSLSQTLNNLPLHLEEKRTDSFRNPNGVYMKLCNIMRLDPNYPGIGLERGSQLEKAVWEEFAHRPDDLRKTARAIVATGQHLGQRLARDMLDTEDEMEFIEGKLLTLLHTRRERNHQLVRRKIREVIKKNGKLACEVCGFNFAQVYGEIGEGFAECHHRKPLSDLPSCQANSAKDLAIVCANCHRMIHRSKPVLTVEQLRDRLSNQQGCLEA